MKKEMKRPKVDPELHKLLKMGAAKDGCSILEYSKKLADELKGKKRKGWLESEVL